MKIKHLRIRNFTSLVDVQLLDLPELVILIGKNSSGKSNLTDALTLFFAEFGSDFVRDLGDLENFQHLFPQNDVQVSPPPELSVSIALAPEEFDFLFGLDEGSWVEIEILKEAYISLTKRIIANAGRVYWITSQILVVAAEEGYFELVEDGEVSKHNVLAEMLVGEPPDDEASWIAGVLSRLANLLGSNIQGINANDSSLSWTDRFTERPSIIQDDHLNELWWLSQSKASQRKPWAEVSRQFEKLAPNEQRPVGISDSVQMQEGLSTFPVGMTGEGSQAMLRLIDRLVRSPQIITVEEPETRLHPALAKKAGRLLAESARNGKQIFVSTHSPFLVDRSAPENIFVVKNEGTGTQISPMGTQGLKSILFDIGVRPSDVLFCDAILLVEGLADENFFEILSNKIGVPLAGRNVKVIKANGKSRGKFKIEFWSEVGREAGIPLYVLLDKSAREEANAAISKAQLTEGNCLILPEGDLEDCYPWHALQLALYNQFGIRSEDPIPTGGRAKSLSKLLRSQAIGNSWKPALAEEVAELTTRDQAESELAQVVGFLRKIFNELGPE